MKKQNYTVKNIGAIIFPVLFLFCCQVHTTSAVAADYGSVNKDGAIIRSGPDIKAEALWEVFKGFPLEIVKKQKTWSKIVDFEGATGWISNQFLARTKTLIVKAKNGNLRIGPGINYEEIALVKYGVVFEPLTREGEWFKVQVEDGPTTGWIHKDLIWPGNH
ncbi:MAG: hypothetical protein A2511_16525 [Deltaproteobacteria bacterium RIFOXYD12_FULL_50_9]|nr:MAG: hypothetical protein A2511_16525 [Deltaproteobacteria bacterium RIFOXYD12_FULL_50_9]